MDKESAAHISTIGTPVEIKRRKQNLDTCINVTIVKIEVSVISIYPYLHLVSFYSHVKYWLIELQPHFPVCVGPSICSQYLQYVFRYMTEVPQKTSSGCPMCGQKEL